MKHEWTYSRYGAGGIYPENWIRIEESPGARLVANLPPFREDEAQAMVEWHNNREDSYERMGRRFKKILAEG